MATKVKSHMLNGQHTAGIFSDMSVDGPPIGTLVVVVDRAKNLPNRKTIGKQDPYCAARLGKEAKKTNTDIRGGQTPRWDQELRFTVHDSPDYFQLKVSVFNDDKKTELIGECWVDLREIIVPGGGQNDVWHQLHCKGKYAGEIRIEITYYDSRPKPEKPAGKAKQAGSSEVEGAAAATGPRAMPKRRPLPSDPITGKPPPAAAPAPVLDHVQTPPRAQSSAPASYVTTPSPLQQAEHSAPAGPRQIQPSIPDRYSPAPASGHGTPSHRTRQPSPQHFRATERAERSERSERAERMERMERPEIPERNANYTDDRGYSSSYPQQQQSHDYSPDPRAQQQEPVEMAPMDSRGMPIEEDRPPPPPAHRTRNGSGGSMAQMYQNGFDIVPAKSTPPSMRHDVLRSEAHRHSVPSPPSALTTSYPGRPTYKAYDPGPAAPVENQYSSMELVHHSSSRHHSYDHTYDPPYRSMQPTVEDVPESPESLNNTFRKSTSRASQFDSGLELVASPPPLTAGGRVPANASANVLPGHYVPSQGDSGRRRSYQGQEPGGFREMQPTVSSRDYGSHSPASFSSYNGNSPKALTYPDESDRAQIGYEPPPVPVSLIPGADLAMTQEISDSYNEEWHNRRWYTQPPPMETPTRGRTMSELPPRYEPESPLASHGTASPTSAHGRASIPYSGGPSAPISSTRQRGVSPIPVRDPSPNPRHTIRRKSISPAPPLSSDQRRLSDIPFGPDSYDSLNPAAAAASLPSGSQDPASRPDYNEVSGKIITHDGREVDPSDHLPMETWAPEPEPKPNKKANAGSTPSSTTPTRPTPNGAQPLPPSGRRALRVVVRPHSMIPVSTNQQQQQHHHRHNSDVDANNMSLSQSASTGRNRLQNKSQHRESATPAVMTMMMSGAADGGGASSSSGDISPVGDGSGRMPRTTAAEPLAPPPPHQDNKYTPPRRGLASRSVTFDQYAPENHAPLPPLMYGSSPGRGARGGGGVPPIPAKVPLALPPPTSSSSSLGGDTGGGSMSNALMPIRSHRQSDAYAYAYDRRESFGGNGDSGGDFWGGGDASASGGGYGVGAVSGDGNGGSGGQLSLMEEMQRIDIGTGRSRRHTQGYYY